MSARAGGEAGVQAAAVQRDSEYEKAEYGVPHCNFEKTAEGFTVTFYRPPAALDTGPAIVGALGAVFLMIGWAIFGGSKIEVTREAITIGRKKLKRIDFGGFNIDHTFKLPDKTLAVLGYSYGRRSFPFGGTWPQGEAVEVAAALNAHLRTAPVAENETRVTATQLRNTRTTDF